MYKIPITIADILIEIDSPLSAEELGIEKRLGKFFGITKNPLYHVAVSWEESATPPAPSGKLIYDPGLIWKMYRSGNNYYAAINYQLEFETVEIKALLNANPTWDKLILKEHRSSDTWRSLLNYGAGEIILRTAALFTGGLVFHSSGIDDNGKGIVFTGHAEAGKSTQARLWSEEPGVIVMNDDRNIVRVEPGGPTCYGTPWGGSEEIARNHSAPLAALILLEQASENSISRIEPSTAAPLLSARAYLPYWDNDLMSKAMTNLNAILENVPVYLLRCRPEAAVIPLVRSVLCTTPPTAK